MSNNVQFDSESKPLGAPVTGRRVIRRNFIAPRIILLCLSFLAWTTAWFLFLINLATDKMTPQTYIAFTLLGISLIITVVTHWRTDCLVEYKANERSYTNLSAMFFYFSLVPALAAFIIAIVLVTTDQPNPRRILMAFTVSVTLGYYFLLLHLGFITMPGPSPDFTSDLPTYEFGATLDLSDPWESDPSPSPEFNTNYDLELPYSGDIGDYSGDIGEKV